MSLGVRRTPAPYQRRLTVRVSPALTPGTLPASGCRAPPGGEAKQKEVALRLTRCPLVSRLPGLAEAAIAEFLALALRVALRARP
jgi:hypothetical protein